MMQSAPISLFFSLFLSVVGLRFSSGHTVDWFAKMGIRAGPNHPIYKIRPNQISEIRKLYGYNDEKSLNDAIDVLEAWVKQQNHFVFKDFSRDYLEAYLITGKGSIERAKKRLDKRCTLRKLLPEMFDNLHVRTECTNLFKCLKHVFIPMPTKDYYRVNIDVFSGDVKYFNLIDYARYLVVTAEYNLVNEYILGFEGVLDITAITLTDILALCNPLVLQKLMTTLMEGFGCRIKAIHIIYDSKLVDAFIKLLKQGLSEKIGNRIQVHSTYETLHKFIDKECLPSDYGGTGPSINETHDNVFKEMSSEKTLQILKKTNNYCTDESKRITGKFNQEYMGMPGSFRSLSVD